MAISDQIISNESGDDPNATNPNSSATGPGQFLNSTWLDMVNKYRPDLSGLPQQQILDMRSDPQLSKDMTGAYANENGQYLAQQGLPVTPGTTYLAHFAGPQGAAKVLSADPNASVSEVLGDKVVSANPFLKDMKASDLKSWADKKMAPAVAGPSSPMMGAPQQQTAENQPPQGPRPFAWPPHFPWDQPSQPGSAQAPIGQPQPGQQPQVPMGAGQQAPQQSLPPDMQALMPTMNAPIRPIQSRFNLAQAYSKIPLPANFHGFNRG